MPIQRWVFDRETVSTNPLTFPHQTVKRSRREKKKKEIEIFRCGNQQVAASHFFKERLL